MVNAEADEFLRCWPSVAFGSTARRLPGWRADCPPGREIGFRPTTSGLPLETDIVRAGRHVSKVPIADIRRGCSRSIGKPHTVQRACPLGRIILSAKRCQECKV